MSGRQCPPHDECPPILAQAGLDYRAVAVGMPFVGIVEGVTGCERGVHLGDPDVETRLLEPAGVLGDRLGVGSVAERARLEADAVDRHAPVG